MSDILANELGELAQWRQLNLSYLEKINHWLRKYDLANDTVRGLIADMRSRLLTQQLKVAFVAEFSRGKSELINAIFFANGGRRIMPASVGRTTMCPVEIGYDPALPPCIRLLPLETRRENISLAEWRYERNDAWVQEELDIDDVDHLAASISRVSERQLVTAKEAADLGLWDEASPEENPSANALGLVEIPKWRHAVVNYPHPLLKRGISILDTPGLNTVGVEPELTLDLLPQAHAVFFILAADTGVTRSDLQIWRDYLAGSSAAKRPCYILLNKIDVLWDGLLTSEQAKRQLQQQRESCAALLNVPLSHILDVSAQKGLLGKIKNDMAMLQSSKLLSVERLFVRDLLPKRKQILHQLLVAGMKELHTTVKERLTNQQQTLDSQLSVLQELHGKNTDIFKQISARIVGQKEALESLRKKASGLRMAEKKLLRVIQRRMSHESINKDLMKLSVAIKDPGMRLSLSSIFEATMDALRVRARKAENTAIEFEALLVSDMQELEKEYGIALTIQPCPGLGNLITDIDMLQNRHEVFFGINQTLKLRRPNYAEQMFKTLLTRTRSIFDEAFDMLDMWSNNSYSALVAQVQDLENAIMHHYEGIQRIQSAKEPLDERISKIEKMQLKLFRRQAEFDTFMHEFDQLAQNLDNLLAGKKVSVPASPLSLQNLVGEQSRQEPHTSSQVSADSSLAVGQAVQSDGVTTDDDQENDETAADAASKPEEEHTPDKAQEAQPGNVPESEEGQAAETGANTQDGDDSMDDLEDLISFSDADIDDLLSIDGLDDDEDGDDLYDDDEGHADAADNAVQPPSAEEADALSAAEHEETAPEGVKEDGAGEEKSAGQLQEEYPSGNDVPSSESDEQKKASS